MYVLDLDCVVDMLHTAGFKSEKRHQVVAALFVVLFCHDIDEWIFKDVHCHKSLS